VSYYPKQLMEVDVLELSKDLIKLLCYLLITFLTFALLPLLSSLCFLSVSNVASYTMIWRWLLSDRS